jgi:hypothetical protein
VAIDETAFTGTGQLGPISPSTSGSLAPGASTTFTASYTLTQADIDSGVVSNTAEATATYFQRSTITSEPSTATLPIQAAGSLSLRKSASPAGLGTYTVGQNITYTFDVLNTGSVTVTDIAIREDAFTGSGVMSAPTPTALAALAPGEATVFTATYTLTQADIDRGTTSNTATATGTARPVPRSRQDRRPRTRRRVPRRRPDLVPLHCRQHRQRDGDRRRGDRGRVHGHGHDGGCLSVRDDDARPR